MFGWTLGAKLAGGNVNFEIGYSDVLGGTAEKDDTGLFLCQFLLALVSGTTSFGCCRSNGRSPTAAAILGVKPVTITGRTRRIRRWTVLLIPPTTVIARCSPPPRCKA